MAAMRLSVALMLSILMFAEVFTAEADEESRSVGAALDGDDECVAGSECALNAIQLRGVQQAAVAAANATEEADGEVKIVEDLPEGWNATENTTEIPTLTSMDGAMQPMWDSYKNVDCRDDIDAKQCSLYKYCRGPRYCVMGGYMIVPGFYAAGMESINRGNAGSFDYLMYAAHDMCGGTSCVLVTNPVGFRTQNELHIHFRHLDNDGPNLKHQLEDTLCGRDGWHYFSKCGAAKARIYSSFPGVFSEVADAYAGNNLGSVGITVWETTACGAGYQTMVLVTTHCSIEHQISNR
mmetsp:Transcript_97939/g.255539  ORF Transcript_97939/g.255539 Transcript_97939/m.255539 type:complete len:294 (+) Transcript_97939:88-969(+)